MTGSNLGFRRDVRDEKQFKENITEGVFLQVMLAHLAEGHCRKVSRGLLSMVKMRVSDDCLINPGNHVDGGDGFVLIEGSRGTVSLDIEFKTKLDNTDFFSLKKMDLERCLKAEQPKPIIMANRMLTRQKRYAVGKPYRLEQEGRVQTFWQCSLMRVRVMDVAEMRELLKYQAWNLPVFGRKVGWTLKEDAWNDWMPWNTTYPPEIVACYRKLFFDGPVEYPWVRDWDKFVVKNEAKA